MAAVLSECQQRFLKRIAAVGRIRPAVQEKLHDIAVAFANREVDRRRVVVLDGRQRGDTCDESFHGRDVAVTRRDEHREDVVGRRVGAIGERPAATG